MKAYRFANLSSLFATAAAISLLSACGEPKQEAPPVSAQPSAAAPVATNVPPAPSTNVPAAPSVPAAISAKEAKDHVGEVATVKGKVFRVYQSKKGDVFIDVDGKYPDAPFTVVCFKEAVPTQELKKLEGKTIAFTGKIKEYNGRVEILLESADQIAEQ